MSLLFKKRFYILLYREVAGRWYTQLTGIRTPISLFIEFFGWPITLVIPACPRKTEKNGEESNKNI